MTDLERPPIVPILGSEFADDFLVRLKTTTPGDEAGLVAMQFEGQCHEEASILFRLMESMIEAKHRQVDAKVIIDGRYVDSMTRLGNRDMPDWVPLTSAAQRKERRENQARTSAWLEQLDKHGVLERKAPRVLERGYVPRLRHLGSFHPAQAFATRHMKGAYVAHTRGDVTAWLSTANLTESDLVAPNRENIGMNNISVRTHGRSAAFIMRALTEGFAGSSGVHTFENTKGLKVVHDIGNSGEPARLPRILTEALEAIDPRRAVEVTDPYELKLKAPKHIVLLSQYLPDGLLFQALRDANSNGAQVYVPLEPRGDYRAKSFPYNIAFHRYGSLASKTTIISEHRSQPSHSKALIVTYDDGSAKLIFGSDNFATHLQKMVRNEELALIMDITSDDDQAFRVYRDLIDTIESHGEISKELANKLLADVKEP